MMTAEDRVAELTRERFDLLVVGGGIHGAWAAWEGARRGLRVALVERDDFGSGSSSNSLKIVHGGFRYLQHADLARLAESLRERAWLTAAAPELVQPLPCLLPAERHGIRRRPLLAAAVSLFDLADAAIAGPYRQPRGGSVGPATFARMAGSLAAPDTPGGIRWSDAIMHSPERILIGVVRAASALGATVANGVEVLGPLSERGVVAGVRARVTSHASADTDDEQRSVDDRATIEIRAAITLDATGAAASPLAVPESRRAQPMALVQGCNVIVDRPAPPAAVAIAHPTEARMLFAVPWRDHLMLGTAYTMADDGTASTAGYREQARRQATELVRDVALACPALELRDDDIRHVHAGLLPADPAAAVQGRVVLLDRPLLVDHAARDGRAGLVSMTGVKWTTAHAVAERAVALCERRLGRTPARRAEPGALRLFGDGASAGASRGPAASASPHLRALYGDDAARILELATARPAWGAPLSPTVTTLGAEVAFAVRYEMAHHLDDVVLRRTELGTLGWPGDDAVTAAAAVAAELLGWSATRREREIRRLREAYLWLPDTLSSDAASAGRHRSVEVHAHG